MNPNIETDRGPNQHTGHTHEEPIVEEASVPRDVPPVVGVQIVSTSSPAISTNVVHAVSPETPLRAAKPRRKRSLRWSVGQYLHHIQEWVQQGGDSTGLLKVEVACGDQRAEGKKGLLEVQLLPGGGTNCSVTCLAPSCCHSEPLLMKDFVKHCGRGTGRKWKQSIECVEWPPQLPPPLKAAPRNKADSPLPLAPSDEALPSNPFQPSTPPEKPKRKLGRPPKTKPQWSQPTQFSVPALIPSPTTPHLPFPSSHVDVGQPHSHTPAATPLPPAIMLPPLPSEELLEAGGAFAEGPLLSAKEVMLAEKRERKRKRARVMKEGKLAMVVYGASEEMMWARRLASFTSIMRAVLGDRRFNASWGGSVVDSIIGTYLTQNVSDVLSSQAFMRLASRFPAQAPHRKEQPRHVDRFSGAPKWSNSANWAAVRETAHHNRSTVMEAIRCRGMHDKLTTNIQAFLNRIALDNNAHLWEPRVDEVAGMLSTLSIHGRHDIITPSPPTGWRRALADCHCGSAICDGLLCLERLRALPSEEATAYIATLGGLGKKSCACISLLCLGHKDFPVDVNVGRICARLGWIPLESEAAIEELDDYAPEPLVHAFLRTRLVGLLSLTQLYELHYQMITLGKVFCSKRHPNCSACPLQHLCEYALAKGPRLKTPSSAPQQPGSPPLLDTLTTPDPESSQAGPNRTVTAAPLRILPLEVAGDAEAVARLVGSTLAVSSPLYDDEAGWEAKQAAALLIMRAALGGEGVAELEEREVEVEREVEASLLSSSPTVSGPSPPAASPSFSVEERAAVVRGVGEGVEPPVAPATPQPKRLHRPPRDQPSPALTRSPLPSAPDDDGTGVAAGKGQCSAGSRSPLCPPLPPSPAIVPTQPSIQTSALPPSRPPATPRRHGSTSLQRREGSVAESDVVDDDGDDVHTQLRARYHSLSRALHPDRCALPRASHAFAAMHRAYKLCCDQLVEGRAAVRGPPLPAGETQALETTTVAGGPSHQVALHRQFDGRKARSDSARLRLRLHAFTIRDEALLAVVAPWLPPACTDNLSGEDVAAQSVLALVREDVDPMVGEDPGASPALPTVSLSVTVQDNGTVAITITVHLVSDGDAKVPNDARREMVQATLLVPCRRALLGRFPLNGTYFQVNEVFADQASVMAPVLLPLAALTPDDATPIAVYTGVAVSSVCRGMDTAEVAHLFGNSRLCIRAIDFDNGAPLPLPHWLMPQRGSSKTIKATPRKRGTSSTLKTRAKLATPPSGALHPMKPPAIDLPTDHPTTNPPLPPPPPSHYTPALTLTPSLIHELSSPSSPHDVWGVLEQQLAMILTAQLPLAAATPPPTAPLLPPPSSDHSPSTHTTTAQPDAPPRSPLSSSQAIAAVPNGQRSSFAEGRLQAGETAPAASLEGTGVRSLWASPPRRLVQRIIPDFFPEWVAGVMKQQQQQVVKEQARKRGRPKKQRQSALIDVVPLPALPSWATRAPRSGKRRQGGSLEHKRVLLPPSLLAPGKEERWGLSGGKAAMRVDETVGVGGGEVSAKEWSMDVGREQRREEKVAARRAKEEARVARARLREEKAEVVKRGKEEAKMERKRVREEKAEVVKRGKEERQRRKEESMAARRAKEEAKVERRQVREEKVEAVKRAKEEARVERERRKEAKAMRAEENAGTGRVKVRVGRKQGVVEVDEEPSAQRAVAVARSTEAGEVGRERMWEHIATVRRGGEEARVERVGSKRKEAVMRAAEDVRAEGESMGEETEVVRRVDEETEGETETERIAGTKVKGAGRAKVARKQVKEATVTGISPSKEVTEAVEVLSGEAAAEEAQGSGLMWATIKGHAPWPVQRMYSAEGAAMLAAAIAREEKATGKMRARGCATAAATTQVGAEVAYIQFFGTLEVFRLRAGSSRLTGWSAGVAKGLHRQRKPCKHLRAALMQAKELLLDGKVPQGWWFHSKRPRRGIH